MVPILWNLRNYLHQIVPEVISCFGFKLLWTVNWSHYLIWVSSSSQSNFDDVFLYCYIFYVQLCVWSSDGWEKQKSRLLQIPSGRTSTGQSDTRVQFHQDQTHFLVVHETQLAIYETTKLECVKQVVLFSKYIHSSASYFQFLMI